MCDDIGIIDSDGNFLEWCQGAKELLKYCPNGIYSVENKLIIGGACSCFIDNYQTAFINGYTYSKIDPEGKWDSLCGYYYKWPVIK